MEQVHLQRVKGRDEGVDAKVELVAVDEEGVLEVPLRNQVLAGLGHGRPRSLADEGNAAPARRRRRLQDPN